MSEPVAILGASSGIARALCHRLAARGCPLILAGRSEGELHALAADLEVRYGQRAVVETFDALECDDLPDFVTRCLGHFDGKLACVVLCYGYLAAEAGAPADPTTARRTIEINFTSAVIILESFARDFERRRWGSIVAISSVAGDRGRQSNYLYGAAKGGLTVYLQGLRNRLHAAGVHVLTVKPGFVDTAMTAGRIDPRSPLLASPQRVARDIDRALRRRELVLYTPWFWRGIMAVITMVPEVIFKRLNV